MCMFICFLLCSVINNTLIEYDKTMRSEEIDIEKEEDIKEKMDTAVLEKMKIEGRGVDKTEDEKERRR